MSFDPSTAEPVTAVVEPEFDPSTAQPVAAEHVGGASGSWGPREASPGIPAQADFNLREEARKARGVAKADLSKPILEIPQLPELTGELNGVEKAAAVGAGVYNEAAKVVSSFTTLPNIALLVTTGGLANAARAGSPAARRALVGIGAYFSGSMAKDAIEQIPESAKVVSDPNASLQEKTAAIASPAITATMSVLAGLGAVHEARPDLTKILRDKTPVEAEAIVREEAAKSDNPVEQAKLTSAADEIATGLKDNEAAKQTFDPGTAAPVQGPEAAKLSETPAGAEKLTAIQDALKSPDTVIQYSVWDKEMIPEGRDRVAQVDLINPKDEQSMGGIASTNRELLKELGVDAPPAPDSLPPGRYTLDEIKAAISREEQGIKTAPELIAEIKKNNPNADLEAPAQLLGDKDYRVVDVPILEIGPVFGAKTIQGDVVAKYMATPSNKPIVLARVDGELRPVDGKHRLTAQQNIGEETIKAYVPVDDPIIDQIAARTEEPAVGLGAASPKEFEPVAKFTTSLKEAARDKERISRGEAPIEKEISKTLGESWEEGARIVDENQNAPDELVAELRETPRSLNDSDVAVLLHRKVDVQNEFNRAARNVRENIGTPDSLAADRATMQRTLDELLDIDEVSAKSATQTGRGLNALKLAASQDFELSTMMAKKQTAKGGAKLTPEEMAEVQRQHADIEDAQRALDQHEAQLELDDAISTPVEAEAQITKLNAEVKAAEVAPKPAKKSPEEKRLEQFKKRTERRIEDLKKRVASGDFSKKPRREIHLDESANLLQAELNLSKERFKAALETDRFKRLSNIQKLASHAANTYDIIKDVMATGEFSPFLRQGLTTLASRPNIPIRAIPDSVRALFADRETADAIDLQTLNSPSAPIARESGLHLDEVGAKLNKMEEAIAAKWGKNIPVLRNFNQMTRIFLNKIRLDSFDAMRKIRPDADKVALEAIADYVNKGTGRGNLGEFGERNAVILNRALFSARYFASRFQYLLGTPMWGGNLASRKIIAREYARTLVGIGAMYAIYDFAKPDDKKHPAVSPDSLGTNFGKIKVGKTTIDPLAGFSQAIVYGSRTGMTLADSLGIPTGGQSRTGTGKTVNLRDPKFGQDDWLVVTGRFARSKLHPIPSAVISSMTGKNIIGQKTSWLNEAENMIGPMTYPDVWQALKEQDVPDGAAISLLAMLGMGIYTAQEKPKKQMGQPPAMLKK